MRTEADIGRAILEGLARANANRKAAAEPLKREIEAQIEAGVPVKQIRWKLSRRVSAQYIYRVRREYFNRLRLLTDKFYSLVGKEARRDE